MRHRAATPCVQYGYERWWLVREEQEGAMMGGMEHFWWGGFGPGFHFSWLWPLFFIFWFSFGHRTRKHGRARQRSLQRYDAPAALPAVPPDPALDALRERFALGEIDRAEYEERRSILLTHPPVTAPKSAAQPLPAAQNTRPEWPDLS